MRIRYRHLPGGRWGLWHPTTRTIFIRDNLTARQHMYAALHELGHAIYQHEGSSASQEAVADSFAAHALIPIPRLQALMDHYRCHITVADRLSTFPHLVDLLTRTTYRRGEP